MSVRSGRAAGLPNTVDFLGFESIQDDPLARAEVWGQDLFDVTTEDVSIGAALNTHGGYQAPYPDRPDQRQRPAPIARFSGSLWKSGEVCDRRLVEGCL